MNMETALEIRLFQIYIIYDITDDAYYVGSAWGRTARDRFLDHMQGKRGGARLIWERVDLGHEFRQEVVEDGEGNWATALTREEWWLHCCMAANMDRPKMNINLYPSRGNRVTISEEEKQKRSERLKGKPRPGGTPWLVGKPNPSKGKKREGWVHPKKGIPRTSEVRAAMLIGVSRRWTCDECGMVSNAAAIGTHQKVSGHIGKHLTIMEEIPPPPEIKTRHPLYACDECELVTTAAGVAAHQRSKGHTGRTFIAIATDFTNNRGLKHDSEYME